MEYIVIIGDTAYRGTREEILEIIRNYHENHK